MKEKLGKALGRELRRLGISGLALLVAVAIPCSAVSAGEPDPPRFVIEGVPFVSWSEAERMDYPDKDVLNPSLAAAWAMISRYWGHESVAELMRADEQSWGTIDTAQDASLGDLKAALRQDGPLVVIPALTPWAHPMPDSALLFMQSGGAKTPRELRDPSTSRLLGVLASIKTLKRLKWFPSDPFLEALRVAARVMVGYDDQRGVILLHDPSFGPVLEVPYAEFESMWSPAGAYYMSVQPRDPAAVPAPAGALSLEPSAEQQALRYWVYGYAQASIGKIDEALRLYRRGLEIPDISDGSRHVLLVEVALCHREKRDSAAALEAARQAAELVPEHYVGWLLLGNLYAESSVADRRELARKYRSEAERLRADPQALADVKQILPHDILVRWPITASPELEDPVTTAGAGGEPEIESLEDLRAPPRPWCQPDPVLEATFVGFDPYFRCIPSRPENTDDTCNPFSVDLRVLVRQGVSRSPGGPTMGQPQPGRNSRIKWIREGVRRHDAGLRKREREPRGRPRAPRHRAARAVASARAREVRHRLSGPRPAPGSACARPSTDP